MTEYFIDAGAAGTGDGLTPANAFVSILSVPWADAVNAWCRRTHKETLTASQFIGINTFNAAFSRWTKTIGWPTSADLYYDIRPAAGVSASWDSDLPSTQAYSSYGFQWPLFSNSNDSNQGMLLPRQGIVANFYLVNCGGTANQNRPAASAIVGANYNDCLVDNVMFTNAAGIYNQFLGGNPQNFRMGKVIVVASVGGGNPLFNSTVKARHLVVHSKCVASAFFSGETVAVDLLESYTSSVANLSLSFGGAENSGTFLPLQYIKRAVGVAPYSGCIAVQAAAICQQQVCDDYFGSGPNFGGTVAIGFVGQTSYDTYSGNAAMRYSVASWGAGQQYYGMHFTREVVRATFAVTSGTLFNVYVPVFCDSTGVFSTSNGTWGGHLMAKGCARQFATGSTSLVGTPSLWAGSLTSPAGAGSAYVLKFSWTPQETASVPFEASFGFLTQATSGANLTAYALMGAPYNA